jgi:hypothetical protein
VVGDFNRDGIPDLVFSDRSGDVVSILLGNGDGTFKPAVTYATAPSPHAIRTIDLNGDGILDLVTANDRSNTISILYGKGDGTFGPHIDLPANSLPKSIGLGDLNGDGRPDIVVTNTTYPTCCTFEGSTISVFMNLGDGKFAPRQDIFVGGNPFSLLVRDLNGDGKADIATANFIDMSPALQWYLKTAHDLGLSGRPGNAVVLALICVIGIVVAGLGWRRYRLPGLLVGLVVLLVLGGGFYKFGKPRLEGDSHITILFGQ